MEEIKAKIMLNQSKLMTLIQILMNDSQKAKVNQENWDSNQMNQLKLLIILQKIIQKQNKNESNPLNFLQYSIEKLDMKDGLDNLFNKENKWELTSNSNQSQSSKLEIRIGFLGNINSGKTYFINQLFATDIPLEQTEKIININIKVYSNIKIIDTPGLRNPKITDKNKSKNRDYFIKSLVLNNCNLIIYVITTYDLKAQKELEEIKQDCSSKNATLIIFHNIFEIQSQSDYDNYIQKYILLRKSIIQYHNVASETRNNKEVFHIVIGHSSFFVNYYDIIERIKQHIQLTRGVGSISFKEIIRKTIEKTVPMMFNGIPKVDLSKSKDNHFYIPCNTPKLNNFDKQVYERNMGITPKYGYYIRNNMLVIELEMVQFTNLTIKAEVNSDSTLFRIKATKSISDEQLKKYSKCSMSTEPIDFIIEVPLYEGVLSNKSVQNKSYENGLLKLEFSLLTDTE